MKCQILGFLGKITKNITNLSSAELAQREVKVKKQKAELKLKSKVLHIKINRYHFFLNKSVEAFYMQKILSFLFFIKKKIKGLKLFMLQYVFMSY